MLETLLCYLVPFICPLSNLAVVGGFADKYGRRLNCLLFALLYGLSCLTKHFNDFTILMIGRLLGGVATSILMSAFETWMIHEHRAAVYSEDWLSSTFSLMTFGSSVVAIVAGVIAYFLAANFGSVAPFDASLLLLAAGAAIIWTRWKENYGEAHSLSPAGASAAGEAGGVMAGAGVGGAPPALASAFESFFKASRLLVANERVLLLGLVQSCFEGAMYIFVFMWTPALELSLRLSSTTTLLPHGIVFAIFMVAIMIGSKVFELLIAEQKVEFFMRWVLVAAAAALSVPILTSDHTLQLAAFCVFEVCCGIYFPSAGTMRSKYIPEEVRSTVMNIYRVGLNALVVLTLINIEYLAQDTVFLFTVFLLTLAVICQHRLFTLVEANQSQEERTKAGLAPGEELDGALATKGDASA